MNVYAIHNTDSNEHPSDAIARVEAHDLMDARLIALRYGNDCVAVLESPAVSHRVADSLIGSLANATLEPMTDAPHRVAGQHVTLDARNVDHWSRNNGR